MATGLDRFLAQQAASDILRDPPSLEMAIQSRARFIIGATALAGNLCSRLDLLERQDDGERNGPIYAPILFVRNNKVTKSDRLLLAFQALTLSHILGRGMPVAGKRSSAEAS